MNYNTYRKRLTDQMLSYMSYMLECDNPMDMQMIYGELGRLKNQVYVIDGMTECQRLQQVQMIEMIIQSSIKF